jgi:hypothetical protein
MWDYVVFLMFGVVLYGFMWFSGVKATFFAHFHTEFKEISHLSRNSPAHLPPHRGTMARDLRWGSECHFLPSRIPSTAPPSSLPQKQTPSSPPPGSARGKTLMKRGLEHQFHKSSEIHSGPN